MKVKRISLVACLFLFLFVVIGNGLHLNPAGAFLAAVTGTPLLIYVFNQRTVATTATQRYIPASGDPARDDGLDGDRGARTVGWKNESVSRQ
ncbi:MAG TPA: hypothetical protein VFA89_03990 [Terriglobales bacterium]|nr:hypothetical protein [Terriglobales bacterium]